MLLAYFAPFADIYTAVIAETHRIEPEALAKVCRRPRKGLKTTGFLHSCQAIRWAASKGVDILAFNASFSTSSVIPNAAIRQAAHDDILIFAAAGFNGLQRSSIPLEEVILTNSADGYGRISPWNSIPLEYSENFAVLGEGITLPAKV